MSRSVGLWGLLVLLCAGCGQPADRAEKLILLCGNSFLPPARELIDRFATQTGIEVEYTVGGSEELLPHVKEGSQGDLFITHDPYLDYTRDAGRLLDACAVGSLAPVLAVPKGNPRGLKGLDDLARDGLKVAFSDPQYSTCGEMVRDLLKKKKLYDAVMKNVENRLTKGHGQLGTFLQTGAVDAALMWNGVACTFKEHVDVVPTPYEYDTEIRVHVIGLNRTAQPETVRQFLAFAREQGPAIFSAHGYVK